jgi:hypothetical protein
MDSSNIRSLIKLVESFLYENVQLTKGSQSVINNQKLVADLARRIRRDARMNPESFEPRFSVTAEKMDDRSLVEWFLSQLDDKEKNGYEGILYSKNGQYVPWLVDKYILGGHNWEDINGTMSMNLSKYDFLKKRDMLDPLHQNIPIFKSIRDLGQYLVYHYDQALKDYNEKMKALAMKKSLRAWKLLDNEDYKIYITLNRAANIFLGQGTTWCTSSSDNSSLFFTYANNSMLFQLFPYDAPEVSVERRDGRRIEGKERYQFDAASPQTTYVNFMNIADLPPDKDYIKQRFPYLYHDIITALRAQKSDIENYIQTNTKDEQLMANNDSKIMPYNVDAEITKLGKFINTGWMLDQPRPVVKDKKDDDEETPPPVLPAA